MPIVTNNLATDNSKQHFSLFYNGVISSDVVVNFCLKEHLPSSPPLPLEVPGRHPLIQLEGLGEHCKLPQSGSGRSPCCKHLLEHFFCTTEAASVDIKFCIIIIFFIFRCPKIHGEWHPPHSPLSTALLFVSTLIILIIIVSYL